METLKNNIKVVTMIPLTVHDGDSNAELEGDAIDTYVNADGPAFNTALVTAIIGAVGADVSEALLKIEESDSSTFASGVTTAEGGEAVDVVAGDLTQTFQIRRTKRYLRAVLTPTEDGAADDVEIAVSAILCDWAKPMPIL
jgi:hypothetical protein